MREIAYLTQYMICPSCKRALKRWKMPESCPACKHGFLQASIPLRVAYKKLMQIDYTLRVRLVWSLINRLGISLDGLIASQPFYDQGPDRAAIGRQEPFSPDMPQVEIKNYVSQKEAKAIAKSRKLESGS